MHQSQRHRLRQKLLLRLLFSLLPILHLSSHSNSNSNSHSHSDSTHHLCLSFSSVRGSQAFLLVAVADVATVLTHHKAALKCCPHHVACCALILLLLLAATVFSPFFLSFSRPFSLTLSLSLSSNPCLFLLCIA